MVEWDMTWANTTPAQDAALDIAMKQKVRGLTEFQVAELILTADRSLWYTQAKNWSEKPPDIGEAQPIWQAACKAIIEIVDLGYDEEAKMWWPLKNIDKAKTKMLLLMDFGFMLEQYRQSSWNIISQGFEPFLEIVCGYDYRTRLKGFVARTKKGKHS